MKFVTNRMLYPRKTIDFPNKDSVKGQSDFAEGLFNIGGVKTVFIANNFVTIGKEDQMVDWYELVAYFKDYIKSYIEADKPIVNEEVVSKFIVETAVPEDDNPIVAKIKDLLKRYVQPAVEMDGGSIVFRSYADGIVSLGMQGACSGCPSSSVTLKAGIESMMKRMIPEVKEVVAESI
ncbi:UNVERIFIED_CONTAM: hypothetical protein GTU68_023198 [Idotea baltica]|nr:hypothetical protein [Idotea baltica]